MEFCVGFKTDALAAPYLLNFVILPIDETVIAETTRIMRETAQEGRGIGMADSMIAATARVYGLPIVTDNVKHFRLVSGLDVRSYLAPIRR